MAVWVRMTPTASGWAAGSEPPSEGGHVLFAARRCATDGTLLAAGKTGPHLRWALFAAGPSGLAESRRETEDRAPFELLAGPAPGHALVWTALPAQGAFPPAGAVVLGYLGARSSGKRSRNDQDSESAGAREPIYLAQVREFMRATPGWYSPRAGTATYGFGWHAHTVTDRSKIFVLCAVEGAANAASLNNVPIAEAVGQVQRLPVTSTVGIRAFAQSHGLNFGRGQHFYELTKAESVGPSKQILVERKADGVIVDGSRARELLQLPPSPAAAVTLNPASLPADVRVYVQSTSHNRHLVAGTTFLYRPDTASATSDGGARATDAAPPAAPVTSSTAKRARSDGPKGTLPASYTLVGNPANPGQGHLIDSRTLGHRASAAEARVQGYVHVYREQDLNSVVARFYSPPLEADMGLPAQAAFVLTIWCLAAPSAAMRLLFNVVETADDAFSEPVYVATTANSQAVSVPAGQAGSVAISAVCTQEGVILRNRRRVCLEVRGHTGSSGGTLELFTGANTPSRLEIIYGSTGNPSCRVN